jgi:PAS domain S-box-containing protein
LRRGFPNARTAIVDDLHQLRESLKAENCDVVITDYWLGWSDGLSVLQQVRERWPRVRVIMLTGNGGEEVVAGAFKYGLYQYLIKPDGFEDIAAVSRAAFESKQREAAHELMASIVDSIPDGVHSVDASGVITAMNPSARLIYGYPDAEIVGRTFEILLPPNLRDQVRRLHEQALCGAIVARFPTVQLRSDGSEIAVAMTIIPVRGIDGATTCVAFIATPMPDAALASSQSTSPALTASPTDH